MIEMLSTLMVDESVPTVSVKLFFKFAEMCKHSNIEKKRLPFTFSRWFELMVFLSDSEENTDGKSSSEKSWFSEMSFVL